MKFANILVLWAVAISCYGHRTNRLYGFNDTDPLVSSNTTGAQIAISDDLVGIYYPYASKIVYYAKEELFVEYYFNQVTRE